MLRPEQDRAAPGIAHPEVELDIVNAARRLGLGKEGHRVEPRHRHVDGHRAGALQPARALLDRSLHQRLDLLVAVAGLILAPDNVGARQEGLLLGHGKGPGHRDGDGRKPPGRRLRGGNGVGVIGPERSAAARQEGKPGDAEQFRQTGRKSHHTLQCCRRRIAAGCIPARTMPPTGMNDVPIEKPARRILRLRVPEATPARLPGQQHQRATRFALSPPPGWRKPSL